MEWSEVGGGSGGVELEIRGEHGGMLGMQIVGKEGNSQKVFKSRGSLFLFSFSISS